MLNAYFFDSVMLNNYQRDLKSIENFVEKKKTVMSSINLLNELVQGTNAKHV